MSCRAWLVRWAVAAVSMLTVLPVCAGDAVRGAAAYAARCGGCHSVETDRIGPHHAGVFGRRAGSIAGYDYSPALRASMGYSLGDAAARSDVIAYLSTLTTSN